MHRELECNILFEHFKYDNIKSVFEVRKELKFWTYKFTKKSAPLLIFMTI